MILTTTNTIEHHKVVEYLGIVTGVSFKMRDLVNAFKASKEGYSKAMEKVLNELKEEAFQNLRANATKLSANAIIGIHIDFEPIGAGHYIGVSVTGTAVKVA